MTDERRELIHQSAHRLRSRLTFVMLCSHTLKLDLRDVLTEDNEREFQEMDRVLEETKTVLNTLLKQLDPEPKAITAPNGDRSELIGVRIQLGEAATEKDI